jgi:hypothetical protein
MDDDGRRDTIFLHARRGDDLIIIIIVSRAIKKRMSMAVMARATTREGVVGGDVVLSIRREGVPRGE